MDDDKNPYAIVVRVARLEEQHQSTIVVHSLDVRVARLEEQNTAAKDAQSLLAASLSDYKGLNNEWRGTVQDITGKCITRLEAQAVFDRMNDKIQTLEKARNEYIGKSSGVSTSWGVILGLCTLGLLAVGTIVSVAALLLRGH